MDEFLDEIVAEFRNLTAENRTLKDKILRLTSDNERLQRQRDALQADFDTLEETNKNLGTQYRDLESSLYTTLDSAKALMSDISASAEKNADIMIENARLEAENILTEQKQRLAQLQQKEKLLKDRVISSRMRFQYLLESELKSLKILDTDILGETVIDEFDEFLNSLDEEEKK